MASVANIDNIFYWDCNCILHQCHLAVRDSLNYTDEFLEDLSLACPDVSKGFKRYFSSIAKLNHFWRERVADFIKSFEQIFGDHGHGVSYRRYPLTCIAGRWGSITSSEDFLLERGRHFLEPTLLALLSKYMKADVAPKAKANSKKKAEQKRSSKKARLLDEDFEDEVNAYRLKLSKWSSGTLSAVTSDLFWLLLRIQNTTRKPWSHLMFYVQKHSSERLLMKLTCGEACRIGSEFRKLIHSHLQQLSRRHTGDRGYQLNDQNDWRPLPSHRHFASQFAHSIEKIPWHWRQHCRQALE